LPHGVMASRPGSRDTAMPSTLPRGGAGDEGYIGIASYTHMSIGQPASSATASSIESASTTE
jgi:hypothetical protein